MLHNPHYQDATIRIRTVGMKSVHLAMGCGIPNRVFTDEPNAHPSRKTVMLFVSMPGIIDSVLKRKNHFYRCIQVERFIMRCIPNMHSCLKNKYVRVGWRETNLCFSPYLVYSDLSCHVSDNMYR